MTVDRDLSPQGKYLDSYSLPGPWGPASTYHIPSRCRRTQRWLQRASTCHWRHRSQKAGRCTSHPVGQRTDTQTDTWENRVSSHPPWVLSLLWQLPASNELISSLSATLSAAGCHKALSCRDVRVVGGLWHQRGCTETRMEGRRLQHLSPDGQLQKLPVQPYCC